MKYIVNVSGGLTSYEALRRCIDRYGVEHTVAIFADTLIEDEDLYRFLDDQERLFGIQIIRLSDGRNPWQVMKDERYITLRSTAPCSKLLKSRVIDQWIAEHYPVHTEYTSVFGMDWTETHRIDRLTQVMAPRAVWFPLMEAPFVDKCLIAKQLETDGIKAPRLYDLGFAHNNCSGGCVKAGQAHWAHLWRTLPDRYAIWEQKEQEIREHLGKDISILKDRRGGRARPLTLKTFRRRLEQGKSYDASEWGGCGCFAQTTQLRMDDFVLASGIKRGKLA